MQVSAFDSPFTSEEAEEHDLVLVDVLAPTFLFPATLTNKDLVKECCDRFALEGKSLKGAFGFVCATEVICVALFYLIDTETREQQNHRMAVLVQDSKFSLAYVEDTVKENDLLRDRLSTALDAFSTNHDSLAVTRAELELERKKRKAAEARVKELERQLIAQKRGTV